MEFDFTANHPFIRTYLHYVANTESPRLMHVWSALSGISAAMGRRCWYPMGTGEIFPNMYVILTGPPAVRKSTAFQIMVRMLRKYTNVRFAPDDTGGQRQGIIAAMTQSSQGNKEDDELIQALAKMQSEKISNDGATTLADLTNSLDELGNFRLDTRDPHSMFIAATELNSVLGEGNTALLTFLQKMWDGDSYKYQLKNVQHEIKEALLGMIGATTPSQLALAMPPEAVGQGFTSRAIFVYADKKHARRIARPTLEPEAEKQIGDILRKVFDEFQGAFVEDTVAASHLDELYERGIEIKDPRFVHYADRRHTHLQKLSMSLAASRGEMVIRDIDVNFADQLLLYTEIYMPDALGEYGMNKLSAAKQRLLDFLKTSDGPIPTSALFGMLSRDMSQLEFKNIMMELHNAGKATLTVVPNIGQCVVAISDNPARKVKNELNQITTMMMAKK